MYSDGSLFDRWAKMGTSRKLRAKLAKHRRSARKATSRKEPETEPTECSNGKTQAATHMGTITTRPVFTGTQFVCFCHCLSGQKLLPDSVCSLAHLGADAKPVWHTGADNARNISEPPACATETFLGSRHSR